MADGGRRILITGLASTLASQLAARFAARDDVAYVAGVDLHPPATPLGRTEFIRADLRNPLVAKVVESTNVDTIVHLAITALPSDAGGRTRMKELNVIGTMQLLAAAQKAPRLQTFVMKSTTAVYGTTYRLPALVREDATVGGVAHSGYTKDAVEVEGYARAFGRRRPDVDLAVLRFANFIGPTVRNALVDYFSLPVIPTVLGYDPRLQLVHTDDAVEVLVRAAMERHPGIVNVAGPGVIYLSQAIRLAGKPSVPVPLPLVDGIAGTLRRAGRADFTPEQLALLTFGRVGDITTLRQTFGFEPAYSTRAAFCDFISARGLQGPLDAGFLDRAEREVRSVLGRLPVRSGGSR